MPVTRRWTRRTCCTAFSASLTVPNVVVPTKLAVRRSRPKGSAW
jgi:hypothetical protein